MQLVSTLKGANTLHNELFENLQMLPIAGGSNDFWFNEIENMFRLLDGASTYICFWKVCVLQVC